MIEGGQTTTITVDDAYIVESIRDPMKKVVAEPPYNRGGMPDAFDDLDERRLKGLIEFMKHHSTK